MRKKFFLFCQLSILLILCFSVITGCNKKSGLSGLYPVKGKVTLKGSPVAGATVNLTPGTVDGVSRPATGLTNAQGEFIVRTLEPGDGMFPGDYYITVTKMVSDGKVPTTEELDAARDSGRRVEIKKKNELPPKYEKILTSGLKCKVDAIDKNPDIVLNLE